MALTTVQVRLAGVEGRSYRILIDDGANAEERFAGEMVGLFAGGTQIALLSDSVVDGLHAARYAAALERSGFTVLRTVVPPGEGSKTLAHAGDVARRWLAGGLDRSGVCVALGGGVVGDLGGFVASIFMRGIPVVQVPTTLLAQVDASVGGKTGVDLDHAKNLLGTFHQPRLVYADVTTLGTLEPRDRVAGTAEVVKHALIADAAHLDWIEANAEGLRAGAPALLSFAVARSCEIKAAIVAGDERETAREGGRALLNLGHTVGHAIESESLAGAGPLRHGEAIALGLVAACRVGQALGVTEPSLGARVEHLLGRLGLPTDWSGRLGPAALKRIGHDKKKHGEDIRFVVLERPGVARVVRLARGRLDEILLGS